MIRTTVTVDVEDYFSLVARDQMGLQVSVSPSVREQNARVLDLLDALGVRATCFVVGRVASAYPDVVRDIAGRGHEVASHGYEHLVMSRVTPAAFARDLTRSLGILQDLTGKPVRGFRAPAFSLGPRHRWAFGIMAEAGVSFDSSVRMVWPAGMRRARELSRAAAAVGVTEIPGLAVGVGRWGIPCGGGGGLRLLPAAIASWAIAAADQEGIVPLYVHPYDVGPWVRYPWPARPVAGRIRVAVFNAMQRLGRNRVPHVLQSLLAVGIVERPDRVGVPL